MSGPIQVIPQGFLGLLDLKSMGALPATLLDQVQPSYDLFAQYIQRKATNEQGLFNVATQGMATGALVNGNHGGQNFLVNGVNAQVPQNEIWYVDQWSCYVQTIAAADTLDAAPEMFTQQGGPILVAPVYADVITARARSWASAPLTRPFWAPPGSFFVLWVTDILTATSITVISTMRAVRMLI